jgi:excisionase family DNA binding protein
MTNSTFVNPDPLLTREEAARYCGMKPTTFQVWAVRGQGPALLHLGRCVRYRKSELDRWLSSCSQQKEV